VLLKERGLEIRKVSDQFSVSGQLEPESIAALQAEGVKTLICNRPDNEAPGQPAHADIERRALAAGMEVRYLPVVHDTINAQNVEDFAALLKSTPAPVHAWCRSGLRSITLWSLAQIKAGSDPAAQVATATRLGFDFRSFVDKFAAVITQLRN
jgi:sulfide:quinone oxidoreductase